eukprot:4956529-Prymnesium_polylepis.1
MALPQGIRGRGSRPRDCTGIDGSEHLHRVNRIHLAPRARTGTPRGARTQLGEPNPRPEIDRRA